MTTDQVIHLEVTDHELQQLIDGLLHLEATDVDSIADHTQLDQVHHAQILAARLRVLAALHRRNHLTPIPPPGDSTGITAA